MTYPERPRSTGPNPTRLFVIATVVVCMITVLYIAAPRGDGTWLAAAGPSAPSAPPAPPASTVEPIPAEAQVFRTRWGFVAAAPDERARPGARARTLAIYHRLRAFPGAPPRIPHGLTEEEYRTTRCLVCHERGGYATRFGAYAPVTPHPELTSCLQCHVPAAMSVGVALPGERSQLVCRQCHVDPDRKPPSLVSLNWVSLPWPTLGGSALPGSPPVIPHTLQFRGDCLACHAGPGAVRELRTRHPERGNCRQCHVTQEPTEPSSAPAGGTGVSP